MTVAVLLDNDVVIKLARMDVYLDAISGMGFTPQRVGSLKPMLRYMGRYDKRRTARFTDNAAEAARLVAALHSIVELEMTQQEAAISAQVMRAVLLAGLDFDEGELAMCVLAISRGNLDFCTADKRALKSLPQVEALWADLAKLRGRCICFEQVFQHLCEQHGLARVAQAVKTCPTTDKAIKTIFDHTEKGGQELFLRGLQVVIEDRISQHARGWLKP
jgi:hypothetical protein